MVVRYLFVICIFYLKSDRKLIFCEKIDNKKILIFDFGVCYFVLFFGSVICILDYDVLFVGKDVGFLIEKFNDYF